VFAGATEVFAGATVVFAGATAGVSVDSETSRSLLRRFLAVQDILMICSVSSKLHSDMHDFIKLSLEFRSVVASQVSVISYRKIIF
jgi:hypothetical protein